MANTSKKNPFEFGDVLCGDFGWSMCIPAWYQVLSVTPSSIRVKRRAEKIVSGGGYQGYSTCDFSKWHHNDDVITCRVKFPASGEVTKERCSVKIRNNYFTLWDGSNQYYDHMD